MLERLSMKAWAIVVFLIIVVGILSYYQFVPRVPDNICVKDEDCIKSPCCHTCNTEDYANYLIEKGEYKCVDIVCVKDYNCKCVEGHCLLTEE